MDDRNLSATHILHMKYRYSHIPCNGLSLIPAHTSTQHCHGSTDKFQLWYGNRNSVQNLTKTKFVWSSFLYFETPCKVNFLESLLQLVKTFEPLVCSNYHVMVSVLFSSNVFDKDIFSSFLMFSPSVSNARKKHKHTGVLLYSRY